MSEPHSALLPNTKCEVLSRKMENMIKNCEAMGEEEKAG